MYIVRKATKDGPIFKTYDGWTSIKQGEAIDLTDVIRFTKGEAKQSNLRPRESFVWYGCYK
jgi:hypothetical protein